MQINAARAVSLSGLMSPRDLNESTEMSWSLAKQTENVEELVVKPDHINKKICPAFIELDEDI